MGNCGSSLDCKCYSSFQVEGCDTEVKVNTDIAGLGILISFYFSALAVFVVVFWGYLTGSLPSNLLRSTDHDAMDLVKGLIRRDNHRRSPDNRSAIQSRTQQRRNEALVGFIKVLSDQQLITGFAILIAALSSRCQITVYEWHVVTSLAYFSATTHSLSLDVLRNYLEKHTCVRYCRILFTLIFLVLFSFVFVADWSAWTNPYINPGIVFQCLLLRVGSPIDTNFAINIPMVIIPILAILWGKHIAAIGRLHDGSTLQATSGRHSTVTIMDRMSLHFWIKRSGLSRHDCENIVDASRSYYDAKIQPFTNKETISLWYFLEQYHESYLSEIPVWIFQFVYGSGNTVIAVWYRDDIRVTDQLKVLGFGQVVAIGLLVLPLLAFVEILNEQKILLASLISTEQVPLQHLKTSNTVARQSTARLNSDLTVGSANTTDDAARFVDQQTEQPPNITLESQISQSEAMQPRPASPAATPPNELPVGTARKIARYSIILCVVSILIVIPAGIPFDWWHVYIILALFIIWVFMKFLITIKRQLSQARFVQKQIRARQQKARSTLQISTPYSISERSGPPSTLPTDSVPDTAPLLPPIVVAAGWEEVAQTTGSDASPTFDRLCRQDTEADIGVAGLLGRRGTGSLSQSR